MATKPPKAFVTVRILSLTALEVGIAVLLFVVREVSPRVLPSNWLISVVVAVRAVELARIDALAVGILASVLSSLSANLAVVTC
jgi:hypothetical protein